MNSTTSRDLSKDPRNELELATPQEFDYAENLNYLSRSPNECLFRIENGRIYKAIPAGGETAVVEISSTPENRLLIRFLGEPAAVSAGMRTEVIRYVRDWFDLDTDLAPFYEMAQSDPLLHRAVNTFYGLRTIGIPDLFEAICWGILGQQINLTFAYTLKRRLVETYGRPVECEGETYWIFPTPQTIAALSVEELTALRMTVKKCEYLIGAAQLIVRGELSKEQLLAAGNSKNAEKILVKIRGIGPWTANYVAMRCLRFPAAFPIDDVGLHNAIKYLTGADRKPTKEEILKLSAAWTNWESYATFYLWRFLY
nr:DNA-3-methyladenine glycosylase [Paenibacillus lutrae]